MTVLRELRVRLTNRVCRLRSESSVPACAVLLPLMLWCAALGAQGTSTSPASRFGLGDDQFVAIQPGSFVMGSDNGRPDERPARRVTLTQAFWLQKTEVTQAQWTAVMGLDPSLVSACGGSCPQENVSWEDVQTFLARLNTATGKQYRLPTEAEWEHAARAGTTGDFGGTGRLEQMGWYNENSGGSTHPVAQKAPNAWGLYDMHGNVWEWVQDWYAADSYNTVVSEDPPGRASGSYRVLRGGSWVDRAAGTRSATRVYNTPSEGNSDIGFRLARTP